MLPRVKRGKDLCVIIDLYMPVIVKKTKWVATMRAYVPQGARGTYSTHLVIRVVPFLIVSLVQRSFVQFVQREMSRLAKSVSARRNVSTLPRYHVVILHDPPQVFLIVMIDIGCCSLFNAASLFPFFLFRMIDRYGFFGERVLCFHSGRHHSPFSHVHKK